MEPKLITVDDYHEFDIIQKYINLVNKDAKVKEIGFKNGRYLGVIYTGYLKDKKVSEFIRKNK